MKKAVSMFLVVLLAALSLCACSSRRFSLVINNKSVEKEVFNYYLSISENDSAYKGSKDKENTAVELCRKYAAENELIEKHKISLTAEEKVAVSGKAKAKWLYFKDFYKKYSVSKQTLVDMLEHEQLAENIIVKIYSEGGEEPVPEEKIKEYYDSNYIVSQVVFTDFTDENGNAADPAAVEEITKKFTEMRNAVRLGNSMEAAVQKYPEIAEYDGGNSLISPSDTAYPEGLFEKVSAMKKGETQVFKYNSIIYLIHRLDESADETYFPLYKKECIINMRKNEVEKMINSLAESYKIVYNK